MKKYLNIVCKMKISQYFIRLLLLVFLFGCDNAKIEKEILQLQSKIISFPCNMNITIHGRDTLIPGYVEKGLKLVIYTDSIDCSSCIISKMYLWNSIMKNTESYKNKLKFYYIISPQEQHIKKIRLALSGADFNYPVLLDTLREFEKLNPHLPKNRALHTFLLDENNNVILVGSPLYNKKIEEMFYKIVEEKLGNSQ